MNSRFHRCTAARNGGSFCIEHSSGKCTLSATACVDSVAEGGDGGAVYWLPTLDAALLLSLSDVRLVGGAPNGGGGALFVLEPLASAESPLLLSNVSMNGSTALFGDYRATPPVRVRCVRVRPRC